MDLLVLSEIGYYLSSAQLAQVLNRYVDALMPSGTLLACHWLGESPDHVLHGNQVHEVIHRIPGLSHDLHQDHSGFRLDRWKNDRPRTDRWEKKEIPT